MMGMGDDLKTIREQVELMSSYFDAKRKAGGRKLKVPVRVSRRVRAGLKKTGLAVCYFGANKAFDFRMGYVDGGLVRVGEEQFEYDPTSVYWWKRGKMPIYGIIQWRLAPVGGGVDAYEDKLLSGVGGQGAKAVAESLGLMNYGQKTIIRGIQADEVSQEEKKKGKKPPLVLIILGVVVVIYLLSRAFGGG